MVGALLGWIVQVGTALIVTVDHSHLTLLPQESTYSCMWLRHLCMEIYLSEIFVENNLEKMYIIIEGINLLLLHLHLTIIIIEKKFIIITQLLVHLLLTVFIESCKIRYIV